MSKNCFFICPIGDNNSEERKRSDKIMKHILNPICDNKKYRVIRADKINSANKISVDIINHLENDEIAVADLTGHNPNVFYEIGYRKAKGMTIIHIAENGTNLPFDTVDDRTIFYDLTDLDNVEEFKQRLSETMDSIPAIKNNLQNSNLECNTLYNNNNNIFPSLPIEQTSNNAQSLESKIIEYAQNNSTQDLKEHFDILKQIVNEQHSAVFLYEHQYRPIKNKLKVLEDLNYVQIQEQYSGSVFIQATQMGINLIIYGNPTPFN